MSRGAIRTKGRGTRLVLVALLAALLLPASSNGLEFRPAPYRASPADSLRVLARMARAAGQWDRASGLRRDLLAKFPGDGFALREIAIEAFDRGRGQDLAKDLEGTHPGQGNLPPGLSGADSAYLGGIVAYYRGRCRTASRCLDRSIRLRPGWGWAHFYRARAGERVLDRADSIDTHVEAALADPDAMPAVMEWLAEAPPQRFNAVASAHAREIRAVLDATPWAGHDSRVLAMIARLEGGGMSPAALDSAWRDLRDRKPATVPLVADWVGRLIRFQFPPPRALQLLSGLERGAGAGEREHWQLHRALLLDEIGYEQAAESLLASVTPRPGEVRSAMLSLRTESDPPGVLAEEAQWLIAELIPYAGSLCPTLELLGRRAEAESILGELESESPAHAMDRRLAGLVASNPAAARALVDSLDAAGIARDWFARDRLRIAELEGDTLSVTALTSLDDPIARRDALTVAASAAYERGDVARGDRMFHLALDYSEGGYGFLWRAGFDAASRRRRDQVADVIGRITARCPGCPENGWLIPDWKAGTGDLEGARAGLRSAASAADLSPEQLTKLAYSAGQLSEPGLADSLVQRAMKAAPGRRDVRYMRACVLLEQGNHAEAARLMRTLLEEIPGADKYRRIMALAGGGTSPVTLPSREAAATPFDVLGQDLASTDWILRAMQEPDSAGDSPVRGIHARASYVFRSEGGCAVRHRVILKMLTPQAAETYRTTRIPFLPETEPPTVRSARIIFPDGRTSDIARTEIVLASPAAEVPEVRDIRHLVIPFAGLKAGAAVDLVWDDQLPGIDGTHVSFRTTLSEAVPVREAAIDIVNPLGIDVRVRQGPLTAAPESTAIGPLAIRRWAMRNLPAMRDVPLGGSPYDRYPWIAASSFELWDAAGKSYAGEFWRRVVASDEILRLGRDLLRQAPDPETRLRLALDSLSARVEYLAIELGPGRYVPSPAPDVLRRGYGDCKDMVTLAIALLEAAGLKAEPVLLAPRSEGTVRRDIAEPQLFTHMVIWVPLGSRGVYCDLTDRPICVGAIGADYEGTLGLRIERSGASALVTIPSTPVGDHGFSMQVDVRPAENGSAEFEVTARFRGEPARDLRALLHAADTSLVSLSVDYALGLGLPETCSRRSWKIVRDDCTQLIASATYADSGWSVRSHSHTFAVRDQVADPLLSYPPAEGRKEPVRLAHGFRDSVVVRLHRGGGWEPSPDLATVSVRGARFGGTVDVRKTGAGENAPVEIRQQFELGATVFSPAEYADFHRTWLRYVAVVYQPYRYRRVLDQARLDEIRGYCRANPGDIGYALQAVGDLLGDDLGGDGPDGRARRVVARELLDPLQRDPTAGFMPFLYLSAILSRDGHYREADALAREALARDAGNLFALAMIASTCQVLGDREGERAYTRELARRSPGDEMQLLLLRALYRDGLDEEAKSVEDRLVSLHGAVDTVQVLSARVEGYAQSGRCGEARAALDSLRRVAPPELFRVMDMNFRLKCRPIAEAVPLIEEFWQADPINPLHCNNLAWAYALLGRDLETAEDLARTAIVLGSGNEDMARNTLGAIVAREGRWKEARAIFSEILEGNEELDSRVANEYFVALCDYQLGKRAQAVQLWKETLVLAHPGEWRERIVRSLELSAQGRPVTGAVFVGAVATPK